MSDSIPLSPEEVVAMMADDRTFPRPRKRKRGRPRKRGPVRHVNKANRAFMNAALFVTQSGEHVPVVRVLVTMPDATARRADALALQLGTSVSGLIVCLIDELPDPTIVPPAYSDAPPVPGSDAEAKACGQFRPLWLPTMLGGKLARILARLGWDVHRFVANAINTAPEPAAIVKPPKTFAGFEEPSHS
jgi:hypothetical protein